ncbi:MAG: hypothetical protein IKT05_07025 [Fibrobacter sp.]|nr:hypothetical protein [Fibrobacter sp.]
MMRLLTICFFVVLISFQGACQAQLLVPSSKERKMKQDSIVFDFNYLDTTNIFTSDSSVRLFYKQSQEPGFLIRLGVCAASALAFKPGGSPALCNLIPQIKR